MQGGRMCEGEGVRRQESVQGHATVMVTGCEVGRMFKGMQGKRQGRLLVFYSNICISYGVSGIVVDLLHTNMGNLKMYWISGSHCINKLRENGVGGAKADMYFGYFS